MTDPKAILQRIRQAKAEAEIHMRMFDRLPAAWKVLALSCSKKHYCVEYAFAKGKSFKEAKKLFRWYEQHSH